MAHEILRCSKCGRFTMKQECPDCGGKTATVRPARFSPTDAYAKYRRIAKEGKHEDNQNSGARDP